MELLLDRRYKKETYTIGIMYVDGKYFSETIEDKDRGLDASMPVNKIRRQKVYGQTAIPTGTYRIDMDTVSPKFRLRQWAKPYGGIVPRLLAVPCYSGVLIHPFNTAEESLGCISVGRNKVKGKVLEATATYQRLMEDYLWPAKLRGEDIYITVV